MGKLRISTAIFHSNLLVYQRLDLGKLQRPHCSPSLEMVHKKRKIIPKWREQLGACGEAGRPKGRSMAEQFRLMK